MGGRRRRLRRRRGLLLVREGEEKVEIFIEPPKEVVEAEREEQVARPSSKPAAEEPKPGYCAGCHKVFVEEEKETMDVSWRGGTQIDVLEQCSSARTLKHLSRGSAQFLSLQFCQKSYFEDKM